MQQCQPLPAADVPLPHITMYLRKSQLPRASNYCGNRNLASTYAWGNHNSATWTGELKGYFSCTPEIVKQTKEALVH